MTPIPFLLLTSASWIIRIQLGFKTENQRGFPLQNPFNSTTLVDPFTWNPFLYLKASYKEVKAIWNNQRNSKALILEGVYII